MKRLVSFTAVFCFGVSAVQAQAPFGVFTAGGLPFISADYAELVTNKRNGFWLFNNVYGNGTCVNGKDYRETLTLGIGSQLNGTKLAWSWPSTACPSGYTYEYSYPEIVFGRQAGTVRPTYNGGQTPAPWPLQISALSTLSATYNISLGANTSSYDCLIDIFVFSNSNPTSFATALAEVSFYPCWFTTTAAPGSSHSFTGYTGYVTTQTGGWGGTETQVFPASGSNHTNILSGTINLLEILNYWISQGKFTSSAYIIGIEFGAEPGTNNVSGITLPHSGSLTFNSLSYNVNGTSYGN